MFLSDFSIKHPAIIGILLVTLVLFSVIAVVSLNQEMFPAIVLPELVVMTVYPGAGVYDIEEKITNILESEFSTIEGVSSITSSSVNSASFVTLQLQEGMDTRDMVPVVREAVNKVMPELPDDIDGIPVIFEVGAGAFLPVYSFVVRSEMDEVILTKILEDEVTPRIARISGVSEIKLMGAGEKTVYVYLDPQKLESSGIAALDVYQALKYSNLSTPAGTANFRGRSMSLRIRGEFESLNDLRDCVVGLRDSSYIYLKDVAEVSLENNKKNITVRSGGRNVMVVDVLKRDDGNTINIVQKAESILNEVEKRYSGIIGFTTIGDQSQQTRSSLNTVVRSALLGVLFAILFISIFLHNSRATFIVGVSIPLSILISLVLMKLLGQSINILTMSGMTVAIGMIVDGSIVVLENTYRHFNNGRSRMNAAALGADEVGSAILASTTTSVCVFIPLLFLTGLIGIIMEDLSLTIVYALTGALTIAVLVVPFMSSKLLIRDKQKRKLATGIDSFLGFLQMKYKIWLGWVLQNKVFVFTTAVVVLVISFFTLTLLEFSFLPSTDTAEIEINMEVPHGFTENRLQEKMDKVDSLIMANVPEIEESVYYVQSSGSISIVKVENEGYGRIRLVPATDRQRTVWEIMDQLKILLPQTVPDMNFTVLNGGFDQLVGYAAGGQGFNIEIYGNDVSNVVRSAQLTADVMRQDPDVYKVNISVSEDKHEIINRLSPAYLGGLGVTSYEAGLTSRLFFTGMEAGQFRGKDDKYDIILKSRLADEEINETISSKMTVKSRSGKILSFNTFSSLSVEPAVSSIRHNNKNVSVMVTGYLKGEGQGGVTRRMTEKLNTVDFPYGVSWRTAGLSELISESLFSMITVLFVAVFLVYAVMVIQFERFAQPLIILMSVPFCIVGVVFGLVIFGSSLSIVSMLGVVALAGIVVNNAIVMVDYINLLRRRDKMELTDAVLKGASMRLKPVLMTTLTTLGGVIPMAFAAGSGAEMYAPLGQVIAGGLFTSTFITLFLVPALYFMIESVSERQKKNKRISE